MRKSIGSAKTSKGNQLDNASGEVDDLLTSSDLHPENWGNDENP